MKEIRIRLKLSQKQFDNLELNTRREMIRQLMFIDTLKYRYCIGAMGDFWTMVRYDLEPVYGYRYGQLMATGEYKVVDGSDEIVDKWR